MKNLVLAAKVIPILVNFAEKMEELLEDMRSLFDGLALESNPLVPLENVPYISRDIPSLTEWGKESTPTDTSTKPDQPGPSKLITETEEEVPSHMEYESPPRRVAEP